MNQNPIYFTTAPRARSGPSDLRWGALPWPALVDGLLAHVDYRPAGKEGKLSGPMISPATFVEGQPKRLENVTGVHWLMLDFDDIEPAAFTALLGSLESEGIAAFAYSTWQHPDAAARGLIRARVGMPISRPCSPLEWSGVYGAALRKWGASSADTSCSDPSRMYFTPSQPVGTEAVSFRWRANVPAWLADDDGAGTVDVDTLVREYGTGGTSAPVLGPAVAVDARDPIPRDAVARLADRLAKSTSMKKLRAGQLMRNGLDGHHMAEAGDRYVTIRDVAFALAIAFPTGSPDSLLEHFTQSLDLMREPGATSDIFDTFRSLIESAQVKVHEHEREKEAAEVTGRARKIGIAWAGSGVERYSPYASDEIQTWEQEGGPLANRWVVQVGSAIYLFFAGTYIGPFSREAIPTACGQWLAPAATAGVDCTKLDEKGQRRAKDLPEMIEAYGRVCTSVELDLKPRSLSRLERNTLVLAAAPLRSELVPTFDPEIAEWLKLLGAAKHDALLDWIATVTWLGECAPALYLMGENGVGKGLLALGLSRLWEAKKATPLKHAMGDFNAAIGRCPLVFADEKVPESWSGQPRTEELRELITLDEHVLNEKNAKHVTAHGAVRVIMAANNLKLVTTKEDLTREDAAALADRIVFVVPSPKAREWFESRGGVSHTRTWITEDKIARHALWLEQCALNGSRPITRGRRLLLPGNAAELTRSIMVGSGVNWRVMSWVYSFLCDQNRHIAGSNGRAFAALVREGGVWINPPALLAAWDHYLPNERPPTLEALTKALRSLLVPVRDAGRYMPRTTHGRASYQLLATIEVKAWLTTEGQDADELDALLAPGRETEALGKPVAAGGNGLGKAN
jgi:hypothetical protein